MWILIAFNGNTRPVLVTPTRTEYISAGIWLQACLYFVKRIGWKEFSDVGDTYCQNSVIRTQSFQRLKFNFKQLPRRSLCPGRCSFLKYIKNLWFANVLNYSSQRYTRTLISSNSRSSLTVACTRIPGFRTIWEINVLFGSNSASFRAVELAWNRVRQVFILDWPIARLDRKTAPWNWVFSRFSLL